MSRIVATAQAAVEHEHEPPAPPPAREIREAPWTRQRSLSAGANNLCGILWRYRCRTGPRRGWTRFTVSERLAIVNRHLADDGRREVTMRTFFRWQSEAVEGGFLEVESGSKRATRRFAKGRTVAKLKRKHARSWLRVVQADDNGVKREKTTRRPRRFNVTSSPPPLNVTSSTLVQTKETQPPTETKKKKKKASTALASGRSRGDSFDPQKPNKPEPGSAAVLVLERELCRIVTKTTDGDWQADELCRNYRQRAVKRQLDEGDSVADLKLAAFGAAIAREVELRSGRLQAIAFWLHGDADPVLVGLANVRKYRKRGLGWLAKVEELSASELERIEQSGALWCDAGTTQHAQLERLAEHEHERRAAEEPRPKPKSHRDELRELAAELERDRLL